MTAAQDKNVDVFSLKPKWCLNSTKNELSSFIINTSEVQLFNIECEVADKDRSW